MNHWTLAASASGVIFASACSSAAPETSAEVTDTSQHLFSQAGTQLWNTTIPICFYQSPNLVNDHSREIGIIQAAITRTWLRAANISATWNGFCSTTGGNQLRINLGAHTQEDGSTDGQSQEGMVGLTAASTPMDPNIFNDPGARIWFQDDGGSGQSRLEYVAVHEFGHVLGFTHEQDRSDEVGCAGGNLSGTTYGPYDPDSIMNYCGDTEHGYLSEGDVMNVRNVYGFKNDYRNALADVNGDGKADALVVNSDAIYVMLSDGTKFNWSGNWTPTGSFVGSRETLFGDVDGDGKADAIAIDNSGVYVMLSDGTKFNWAGKWSDAFYGERKTLAADVSGDGKVDLIAISNDANYVTLSNGSAFTSSFELFPHGSAFYGTRATFAGDVDGDGKAELIATSIAGWQIQHNDSAFLPSFNASKGGATTSGPYAANSRATAIADVDGDGKADMVALNDWGIDVSLSTGSGFGPVAFSTGPFYGSRVSLLADVDGDHKIDAVAVNDDGQLVMTSTGTSFVSAGQWSGNFVSQPY